MPSQPPSDNPHYMHRINSNHGLSKNREDFRTRIDYSRENGQNRTLKEEIQNIRPQPMEKLKIVHNQPIVNTPLKDHCFYSSQQHTQNLDQESLSFEKQVKDPQLSEDQDDQADEPQTQNEPFNEKFDKYLDLINQGKEFSTVLGGKSHNLLQRVSQKNQAQTERLQQLISKTNISVLNYQQFIPSIRLVNIRHFASYEIVKLDVRVGKYEKSVTIYNLLEESCFHSMKPFNSGSFGNIYLWRYMKHQFVVKCITKTSVNNNEYVANGKNKQIILVQILKEYMIAYIAGLLEIGPKVVNPFGFDLIVSRKCIEFFIERVSLPQYHLENMHSKFDEIKKSLFNLHLLNIVHNDIKPQNIMYSQSTKKLLFIDFGLSEYIDKPIGHKKSTKFIGTYQYSSPQMQKLLFENETGLIDLYYNDAYSLNMALNKLFQIQKGVQVQEKSKQPQNIENMITGFLNKIYLKYSMLEQKIHDVITLGNIIQLKPKFQLQSEILDFLQRIPFSPQLKHFYHESIHDSVKEMPRFSRLQDLYVKNVSPLDVELQYKDQNYKDFVDLYQHFQNMQLQEEQGQTTFRQRLMTKSQKKLLIMSSQQKFSRQKIFSLYLDLIHFLKRTQNISLQQKAQISLSLIKRFDIPETFCNTASNKISRILEPIFECLYYLLKQCVQRPLNKWKTQNLVKVAAMLMTLGWDIPDKYLQQWRHIFCTSLTDINDIMHIYLQFMILQRLSIERYFKIYNQKSLKQVDLMIRALHQQGQLSGQERKSVYKHFLDQRKLQKTDKKQYSNQPCQGIFISMLQFDQNPQSRTEQKLDSLLKEIEQLPYSHFKNKKHYQWTKTHLVFWIVIYICKLRTQQQKQLKILLKIKKQTLSQPETFQFHIFTFQILSKYSILKNFAKMRQQLDIIDQTINAPLISQNICIHRRLMMAFLVNDFQKVERIIDKVHTIKQFNFSQMNLFRHLSVSFQNSAWAFKDIKNYEDYRVQLNKKIQSAFHNFMMQFKDMKVQMKQKINRQVFSEFMRPIFTMRFNCQKFEKLNIICKNQEIYLQIFDSMLREYPDKEMFKSYTISKLSMLRCDNKFEQMCQFIEKDERLNFSNLSPTNYVDLSIIIEYYRTKLFLRKNDDLYTTKFRQLYEELVDKKSFFNIFNNRNFYELITKRIQDDKLTLQYFKLTTEHLTLNPSIANTQIMMNYMNNFRTFGINKARFMAQQIGCSLEFNFQQYLKYRYGDKRLMKVFQLTQILFRDLYQLVRSQVKKCKIWQNPYLVLVLFCLSMVTQNNSKEIRKIHFLTSKAMSYMNYPARRYIMNWYYWRINSNDKFFDNKRYTIDLNAYLNKKHLKHTWSKCKFQQILKLRIKNTNYHEAFIVSYPGYMHVRQKLYNYYNNAQILQVIDNNDISSSLSECDISDQCKSEAISECMTV